MRSGASCCIITLGSDEGPGDHQHVPAPPPGRLRALLPGHPGALPGPRPRRRRPDDHDAPDVVSVWNMGALSMGILEAVLVRGVPTVLVVCDDWLVYGPVLDAWA